MITKEELKELAHKLMFDIKEEEYQTLQEEFSIMLEDMEKIEKLEQLEQISPMFFPFQNKDTKLREDRVGDYLTTAEVLENTKYQTTDQIKIPKVVNEDV